MRLVRLALADLDFVTLEFGAVDEGVEPLVRGLLGGEDEVVAGFDEPLDDALAGEQIVGQVYRAQELQARGMLVEPAFEPNFTPSVDAAL